MSALTVRSLKAFMNSLLIADTFDCFQVSEATITTFTTFSIDGILHPDFYGSDRSEEIQTSGRIQVLWKEIKPYCFSVIKGKHTPLSFKFVLQLPKKETLDLIEKSGLPIKGDDLFGLYVNCQYNGDTLTLTTGTSLRVFTLDKSLDHAWDQKLKSFLSSQNIEVCEN